MSDQMSAFQKYIQRYLDLIPSDDWLQAMEDTKRETIEIFSQLSEKEANSAYREGKWTLKVLLQHLTETEKIFNYRALRFSKKDEQIVSGFDEDAYTKESNAKSLTAKHIVEEFTCVRNMSILFFKGLDSNFLKRKGMVEGNCISVETIGKLTVGHHIHHLNIIKERYL